MILRRSKNISDMILAYCLSLSCSQTAQILGCIFSLVRADSNSSNQSMNRVKPVSAFQTVKTWQPAQRLLNLTLTWKWSYLHANFRLHASEFPACYVGVLHVIKACMPSHRWAVVTINNFIVNFKACGRQTQSFYIKIRMGCAIIWVSNMFVTHHQKHLP